MRTKQLKLGLTQLGEEGAIQVFRPHLGSTLLLGAVGNLQFEVVTHRLQHEYGVDARIASAKYQLARWITSIIQKTYNALSIRIHIVLHMMLLMLQLSSHHLRPN